TEHTCRYSLVCNDAGGVKDDVLVYRFEDRWLLVVNAANREKLLEHFEAVRGDLNVKISDTTETTAMVAVQGPKAMEFVSNFSKEIPSLRKYHFTIKNLMILKLVVSRTGYSGEDGIEIILPCGAVDMALKLLFKDDPESEQTVAPCGLGARDVLRLEAGMPLYGHELTEQIDPLSAGLSFGVTLDKDTDQTWGEPEKPIGADALKRIAEAGPESKLVGLKLDGRRTPRQDMPLLKAGHEIGYVTSGCMSPTLGHPIAMAYVDAGEHEAGTAVEVNFGRQQAEAQIVSLPFYKAERSHASDAAPGQTIT
ncbi:MAG: hypothetical protein GVY28_03000, partial [Alphaproteobacteria bacterium]|nr:hypothetical protein [Alphaproteobacteria bacterium]